MPHPFREHSKQFVPETSVTCSLASFRDRRLPNRVVASIQNRAATRCVDIFVRDDGTFGFEEYRRDHEDGRGWFLLPGHGHQVFDTEQRALEQAKATVAWMLAGE